MHDQTTSGEPPAAPAALARSHPSYRPPLVLASASPRRRELLAALGVPFTVRAADVPEPLTPDRDVTEQAISLARVKVQAARALLGEQPPGAAGLGDRSWGPLVLGADTIVALDGRPLGKPRDAGEARTMLLALRDRDHEVVTGVALAMEGAAGAEAAARTRVRMRAYTDDEVAAYIATGDPFDKAGGYAIQHPHFRPVARIDGCYCNVVGLPLWTVRDLLRRLSPDLAPARPSLAIARCTTCPLASAH